MWEKSFNNLIRNIDVNIDTDVNKIDLLSFFDNGIIDYEKYKLLNAELKENSDEQKIVRKISLDAVKEIYSKYKWKLDKNITASEIKVIKFWANVVFGRRFKLNDLWNKDLLNYVSILDDEALYEMIEKKFASETLDEWLESTREEIDDSVFALVPYFFKSIANNLEITKDEQEMFFNYYLSYEYCDLDFNIESIPHLDSDVLIKKYRDIEMRCEDQVLKWWMTDEEMKIICANTFKFLIYYEVFVFDDGESTGEEKIVKLNKILDDNEKQQISRKELEANKKKIEQNNDRIEIIQKEVKYYSDNWSGKQEDLVFLDRKLRQCVLDINTLLKKNPGWGADVWNQTKWAVVLGLLDVFEADLDGSAKDVIDEARKSTKKTINLSETINDKILWLFDQIRDVYSKKENLSAEILKIEKKIVNRKIKIYQNQAGSLELSGYSIKSKEMHELWLSCYNEIGASKYWLLKTENSIVYAAITSAINRGKKNGTLFQKYYLSWYDNLAYDAIADNYEVGDWFKKDVVDIWNNYESGVLPKKTCKELGRVSQEAGANWEAKGALILPYKDRAVYESKLKWGSQYNRHVAGNATYVAIEKNKDTGNLEYVLLNKYWNLVDSTVYQISPESVDKYALNEYNLSTLISNNDNLNNVLSGANFFFDKFTVFQDLFNKSMDPNINKTENFVKVMKFAMIELWKESVAFFALAEDAKSARGWLNGMKIYLSNNRWLAIDGKEQELQAQIEKLDVLIDVLTSEKSKKFMKYMQDVVANPGKFNEDDFVDRMIKDAIPFIVSIVVAVWTMVVVKNPFAAGAAAGSTSAAVWAFLFSVTTMTVWGMIWTEVGNLVSTWVGKLTYWTSYTNYSVLQKKLVSEKIYNAKTGVYSEQWRSEIWKIYGVQFMKSYKVMFLTMWLWKVLWPYINNAIQAWLTSTSRVARISARIVKAVWGLNPQTMDVTKKNAMKKFFDEVWEEFVEEGKEMWMEKVVWWKNWNTASMVLGVLFASKSGWSYTTIWKHNWVELNVKVLYQNELNNEKWNEKHFKRIFSYNYNNKELVYEKLVFDFGKENVKMFKDWRIVWEMKNDKWYIATNTFLPSKETISMDSFLRWFVSTEMNYTTKKQEEIENALAVYWFEKRWNWLYTVKIAKPKGRLKFAKLLVMNWFVQWDVDHDTGMIAFERNWETVKIQLEKNYKASKNNKNTKKSWRVVPIAASEDLSLIEQINSSDYGIDEKQMEEIEIYFLEKFKNETKEYVSKWLSVNDVIIDKELREFTVTNIDWYKITLSDWKTSVEKEKREILDLIKTWDYRDVVSYKKDEVLFATVINSEIKELSISHNESRIESDYEIVIPKKIKNKLLESSWYYRKLLEAKTKDDIYLDELEQNVWLLNDVSKYLEKKKPEDLNKQDIIDLFADRISELPPKMQLVYIEQICIYIQDTLELTEFLKDEKLSKKKYLCELRWLDVKNLKEFSEDDLVFSQNWPILQVEVLPKKTSMSDMTLDEIKDWWEIFYDTNSGGWKSFDVVANSHTVVDWVDYVIVRWNLKKYTVKFSDLKMLNIPWINAKLTDDAVLHTHRLYNYLYSWLFNYSSTWGFANVAGGRRLNVMKWRWKWNVIVHENKHSTNKLVFPEYILWIWKNIDFLSKKLTENDYYSSSDMLKRAKDEIIAYLQEWRDIDSIKKTLLTKQWLYDYYRNEYKDEIKKLSWPAKTELIKKYTYLVNKHIEYVSNLINIAENLTQKAKIFPDVGLNKQKILDILSVVPFNKREKIGELYEKKFVEIFREEKIAKTIIEERIKNWELKLFYDKNNKEITKILEDENWSENEVLYINLAKVDIWSVFDYTIWDGGVVAELDGCRGLLVYLSDNYKSYKYEQYFLKTVNIFSQKLTPTQEIKLSEMIKEFPDTFDMILKNREYFEGCPFEVIDRRWEVFFDMNVDDLIEAKKIFPGKISWDFINKYPEFYLWSVVKLKKLFPDKVTWENMKQKPDFNRYWFAFAKEIFPDEIIRESQNNKEDIDVFNANLHLIESAKKIFWDKVTWKFVKENKNFRWNFDSESTKKAIEIFSKDEVRDYLKTQNTLASSINRNSVDLLNEIFTEVTFEFVQKNSKLFGYNRFNLDRLKKHTKNIKKARGALWEKIDIEFILKNPSFDWDENWENIGKAKRIFKDEDFLEIINNSKTSIIWDKDWEAIALFKEVFPEITFKFLLEHRYLFEKYSIDNWIWAKKLFKDLDSDFILGEFITSSDLLVAKENFDDLDLEFIKKNKWLDRFAIIDAKKIFPKITLDKIEKNKKFKWCINKFSSNQLHGRENLKEIEEVIPEITIDLILENPEFNRDSNWTWIVNVLDAFPDITIIDIIKDPDLKFSHRSIYWNGLREFKEAFPWEITLDFIKKYSAIWQTDLSVFAELKKLFPDEMKLDDVKNIENIGFGDYSPIVSAVKLFPWIGWEFIKNNFDFNFSDIVTIKEKFPDADITREFIQNNLKFDRKWLVDCQKNFEEGLTRDFIKKNKKLNWTDVNSAISIYNLDRTKFIYIYKNYKNIDWGILWNYDKNQKKCDLFIENYKERYYQDTYKSFIKADTKLLGKSQKYFFDYLLLLNSEVFLKDQESVQKAIEMFQDIKTLDVNFVKAYLKVEKKWEKEKKEFIEMLKNNRKKAIKSQPLDEKLVQSDMYIPFLESIYARWNYDVYENLNEYGDRSSDLEGMVFDEEWTVFVVSNIDGHYIKEWEEVQEWFVKNYEKRFYEFINKLNTEEKIVEYIDKIFPGTKSSSVEGKIIEFLQREDVKKEDLDVLMAYHLLWGFQEFINATTDQIRPNMDAVNLDYIKLEVLNNHYGDQLKVTLNTILAKIRNSDDIANFSKNTVDVKQIEAVWSDVYSELVKTLSNDRIPEEKRKSIVYRKIKWAILIRFQWNEILKWKADEIAWMFGVSDFDNKEAFQSKFQKLISGHSEWWVVYTENIEEMMTEVSQELETEISKYGEQKSEWSSSKNRRITGYFSKTKENALARMVWHICIATDHDMWKNPNYFEYVMFDEAKQKNVWTVMLLTIEDRWKKYLLFWPNPSEWLTSEVSAKKLYFSIRDEIAKFAEENWYDGVILDTKYWESTNRAWVFQDTLKNSVLTNKDGTVKIIDLEKSHILGGGHSYQKGLNFVWERKNPSLQ